MKNRQRLIGITVATALMLSLTTTALAAGNTPGGGSGSAPTEEERKAHGDTTISIMQTTVDPTNVSFTVPLYVTMAVVSNDADVKVPGNYGITNTSTGGSDAKIGVTNMSFEKLSGSTYKTKDYNASATLNNDELMLTIGGVDMPARDTAGVSPVDLEATSQRTGHSDNKFWDSSTNQFKAIAPGATTILPLAGTVASATRSGEGAVAQFKVKYTISILDATSNKPLGWVYAGDDRTQAGLGEFTP